ncbi:MAG: Gfo/Idh/MocA family oxidoreductase [Vicinamibacterales bacterium]
MATNEPRRVARGAPVRYAVVGLGHLAQSAVLPAFAHASRNSVLTAIVSGDRDKLTRVGDAYGLEHRYGYDDYERCLEQVDAVYIAVPNAQHAAYALPAARAGVHVLCEKPLAAEAVDAHLIVNTCREQGVRLMTAYRLHFERLTLEVIDLVQKGRIGAPRYFASTFSMTVAPGNVRTRDVPGAGTLYDLGVYCINMACTLFDADPEEVYACAVPHAGAPVDGTTAAILRFDDGRLASFTTSFDAAPVSAYRIVGTDGDIRSEPAYEYAEPIGYVLTTRDGTRRRRGRLKDQFAAELLYFSDCVRRRRDPEPSGTEGARDVRVVQALYESAAKRQPVRLATGGHLPPPTPSQAIDQPPVEEEPELIGVHGPRR